MGHFHGGLRLALILVLTLIIGLYLPFTAYAVLAQADLDISGVTAAALIACLLVTGLLAWTAALRGVQSLAGAGRPQLVQPAQGTPGRRARREDGGGTWADLWARRTAIEMDRTMVPLNHVWATLRSPHVSVDRRLATLATLIWRPWFVWLGLQIPALGAFWLWRDRGDPHHGWIILLAIMAALYVAGAVPAQIAFMRRQIAESQRVAGSIYLPVLFHLAAGNSVARMAQFRRLLGDVPAQDRAGRRAQPAPAVLPLLDKEGADLSHEPVAVARTAQGVAPADTWRARPVLTIVGSAPHGEGEPPGDVAGVKAGDEQFVHPVAGAAAPIDGDPVVGATADDAADAPVALPPDDDGSPLAAARHVAEVVQRLAEEVERYRRERMELLAQIELLQRQQGTGEQLRERLLEVLGDAVPDGDLAAMERVMAALVKDPNHILVLASVSQRADQFAEIVRRYIRIQQALDGSQ